MVQCTVRREKTDKAKCRVHDKQISTLAWRGAANLTFPDDKYR
jgi:hypothetical protein